MIWFILIAITAVATALMFIPLWRQTYSAPPREAFDAQIYRDQLTEVESDFEAGRITDEQAESARTEIARRLLATTPDSNPDDEHIDQTQVVPDAAPISANRTSSAVIAVTVPIAALGLYLVVGSPHLPGRPAAEVKAQLPAIDNTAQAESAALLARVGEQLKDRPNDLRGWTLYAKSLVRARRFAEGETAYRRATKIAPSDAELRSRLAEAQIFATNGMVTPEARETLDKTLAIDPKEPRALFYMGLAESQAGRIDQAMAIWIGLEADSSPEAPWRAILSERIAKLAAQSNISPDQLAERRKTAGVKAPSPTAPTNQVAQGPRGPTTDDVKAAQSMSASDRMDMIRGMVAGLAERLENEPDDIDGWQRLARSYGVLGETKKARDAFAHIAKKQPNDVKALSDYAGALAGLMPKGAPIPPELAAIGDKILSLDSSHSSALWFTGMARAQAGDSTGARERWTRLLAQLDPKSPQHATVEKNIKALGDPSN